MKHPPALGEPAELAALYAIGAMPSEERERFEAHLATGCADCATELTRFQRVAADLAAAMRPVAPPAQLRSALLRRVAASHANGAPSPLGRLLEKEAPPPVDRTQAFVQRADHAVWEATDVEGVNMRLLFVDRDHNRCTALVRMAPGASYPGHVHNGPEECLVLEGELHAGDTLLRPGDYQRMQPGSHHGVQHTTSGCLLLITSSLSDVLD
jgi:anti-sigma factor ChrR (cupin superfamily)